ncbi:uncharacterized protein LOC121054759 [Oryza brachyantha]|uniref:uncharacterized protein LOC121054759 n=1 Tax=Oryza brachyantha TaxID=4533 RepID=UPI001ADB47CC|nr:uncharacterized protein LOC121054759 [Oryza brachyantha]
MNSSLTCGLNLLWAHVSATTARDSRLEGSRSIELLSSCRQLHSLRSCEMESGDTEDLSMVGLVASVGDDPQLALSPSSSSIHSVFVADLFAVARWSTGNWKDGFKCKVTARSAPVWWRSRSTRGECSDGAIPSRSRWLMIASGTAGDEEGCRWRLGSPLSRGAIPRRIARAPSALAWRPVASSAAADAAALAAHAAEGGGGGWGPYGVTGLWLLAPALADLPVRPLGLNSRLLAISPARRCRCPAASCCCILARSFVASPTD